MSKIAISIVVWIYSIAAFFNMLHPDRWTSTWDIIINVGGAMFIATSVYYGSPIILNAMMSTNIKKK